MTLFARVGRALHGEQFRGMLADALKVDLRTVQRWASGEFYPPAGVWRELLEMLDTHEQETCELINQIEIMTSKCPHCGSANTRRLGADERECWDCRKVW